MATADGSNLGPDGSKTGAEIDSKSENKNEDKNANKNDKNTTNTDNENLGNEKTVSLSPSPDTAN